MLQLARTNENLEIKMKKPKNMKKKEGKKEKRKKKRETEFQLKYLGPHSMIEKPSSGKNNRKNISP